MSIRPFIFRTPLAFLLAGAVVFGLTGCPKDPYDPDTWIAQLDDSDPHVWTNAVTELERLKDPAAIKPLGEAWRKYSKHQKILRAIVKLADQPDVEGGPYWDDAIPVLVEAVEDYEDHRRSIEDASFAAEALGRSKNPEAVSVLVTAATQKMPKLSDRQRVRIAALKALGNFADNPKAVDTLIKVLGTSVKDQPFQLNAAAARSLAESKSDKAIQPLLKAYYEIPIIGNQVRYALVMMGGRVIPELIKILDGKHAELNKYAEEKGFATDCDKAMGPKTKCIAPGNLPFKASVLLGDLYAKEAVPSLVAALKKPPLVAFFDPRSGLPGPSTHQGMLDAMRKIGGKKAIQAVGDFMKDESTDDESRPMAIEVYSMLASDASSLGWLAKQMKDDSRSDPLWVNIRKASALGYSRLATKANQLGPLDHMINTYKKKRKEWLGKVAKAKKESDKADAESWVQNYDLLIAEFSQYKARAQIGIECKGDPKCLAAFLDMKADEVVAKIKVPHADKMKKAEKSGYRIAAIERALLDLAKLGPKGRPALDSLLTHLESTQRIIRQGVHLALVQVAEKPCEKCLERIDHVIETQKDQTTLDLLVADTRAVREFFRRK